MNDEKFPNSNPEYLGSDRTIRYIGEPEAGSGSVFGVYGSDGELIHRVRVPNKSLMDQVVTEEQALTSGGDD